MLKDREFRMRKLEERLVMHEDRNKGTRENLSGERGEKGEMDNWFTRWMTHEWIRGTTVGQMWKRLNFTENDAPFSFADRARAFELYNEDHLRRLQMAQNLKLEMTLSQQQRISLVERTEAPLLKASKAEYMKAQIQQASALLQDAKKEIEYSSYDPETAANLASQAAAALEAQRRFQMDTRRNISQTLTRVSIYRDRLVRAIIPQLTTNTQDVYPVNTDLFNMKIARVTNMSNWGIGIFPSEFIVPNDSPNEATATNPVTAFAFQYIEYRQNIYSWSPSTPRSLESAVITLLV
jgi:hypothetical protein